MKNTWQYYDNDYHNVIVEQDNNDIGVKTISSALATTNKSRKNQIGTSSANSIGEEHIAPNIHNFSNGFVSIWHV